MARKHSYIMFLDVECDALVLDIFQHFLVSIKDDHSTIMLAHTESILVGSLDEVVS